MVAEHTGKENSDTFQQEGIGADWEDAFQAEDFLISPDTAPGTLFEDRTTLATGKKTGTTAGGTIPSARATGEKATSLAGGPVARKRGRMPPVLVTLFEAIGNLRILTPLQRFSGGIGRKFFLLAPVSRGVVLVSTAVLVIAVVAVISVLSRSDAPVIVKPPGPVEEVAEKKIETPPSSATTGKPEMDAPLPGEEAPASRQAQEKQFAQDGFARHKWRFSSFMIDAGVDESGKPKYVAVDLSLVLLLEQGEEIPADKEYAVRNMIYQFFSNRPPYELRRFSLARGEMKQKLNAWFKKEWPGNPVESIFFHRYQII